MTDRGPVAAIIGAGRVGRVWVHRFLSGGWQVQVFEPEDAARDRLSAEVDVTIAHRLSFHEALTDVRHGADWLQVNVPGRPMLRRLLVQRLQADVAPPVLCGCSTTEATADILQDCALAPQVIFATKIPDLTADRPAVHLDGGTRVTEADIERAGQTLKAIGFEVTVVR